MIIEFQTPDSASCQRLPLPPSPPPMPAPPSLGSKSLLTWTDHVFVLPAPTQRTEVVSSPQRPLCGPSCPTFSRQEVPNKQSSEGLKLFSRYFHANDPQLWNSSCFKRRSSLSVNFWRRPSAGVRNSPIFTTRTSYDKTFFRLLVAPLAEPLAPLLTGA